MAIEKRNRKRQTAQVRKSSLRGNARPGSDFFVWPHPFWMIVVIFGLYLLVQSTVKPQNIPGFLGPLRSFAYYMGTEHNRICVLLCVFATAAHCSEAAYAGKVCHDRGMTTGATIKVVIPETGPRKRKGETVRVIDAVRCLKTFIRRNVSQGTEGVRTATTTEKLQSS
ncbi:hypothetical protein RRG08_015304 [Elysia crispata]|uniref:Transmembrane protein 254 n=1 Tax=Elysia crispata TaxID=231223 RepID=A0AAE1DM26_9GAST|nr:hypothetical protein RRG08_015304 [Elysia crispata]